MGQATVGARGRSRLRHAAGGRGFDACTVGHRRERATGSGVHAPEFPAAFYAARYGGAIRHDRGGVADGGFSNAAAGSFARRDAAASDAAGGHSAFGAGNAAAVFTAAAGAYEPDEHAAARRWGLCLPAAAVVRGRVESLWRGPPGLAVGRWDAH